MDPVGLIADSRNLVTRFLLPVLVVAPISSCGSDGGETSETAIENDVAAAFCSSFFDCGCPDLDASRSYEGREQCVTQEAAEFRAVLDAGARLGLTLDVDCVDRLQSRFLALGCDPDWRNAGPYVHCRIHHGDKTEGEPCSTFPEADGDDCTAEMACWAGVCQPRKEAFAIGEECPFEHPYCDDGAVCVDLNEDGAQHCEALPGAGAPCLYEALCARGFNCGPDATCLEVADVGDGCDEGEPACDAWCGLVCDETEGRCVPDAQSEGELGHPCVRDTECVADSICDNGVCAAANPYVCRGSAVEPLPNPLSQAFCEAGGR